MRDGLPVLAVLGLVVVGVLTLGTVSSLAVSLLFATLNALVSTAGLILFGVVAVVSVGALGFGAGWVVGVRSAMRGQPLAQTPAARLITSRQRPALERERPPLLAAADDDEDLVLLIDDLERW